MSLHADAPLVVIVGENASGKTSILEAISCLLYGSSFRTRKSQQLIRFESEGFVVRAEFSSDVVSGSASAVNRVATERKAGGADARFRLNGEDVRPAALVRKFPLQVIDASVFGLIEGSPSERRRFVDWGMFHVKPDFYDLWREHRKVLRHWNALLRRRASRSEFDFWKSSLVSMTNDLTTYRRNYVESLSKILGCVDLAGFDSREIELGYQQGWTKEMSYEDYLTRELDTPSDGREFRLRGGTQFFDMTIRQDGRMIKDTFSRGQKKVLGLQLKVAQIKLYNEQLPSHPGCTVLVDDIAAEVDYENQKRAMNELLSTGSQVFVTAIDPSHFQEVLEGMGLTDCKVFHVKQGELTELLS